VSAVCVTPSSLGFCHLLVFIWCVTALVAYRSVAVCYLRILFIACTSHIVKYAV
jgi:hypothetical protein